jgi:hypothetical protein
MDKAKFCLCFKKIKNIMGCIGCNNILYYGTEGVRFKCEMVISEQVDLVGENLSAEVLRISSSVIDISSKSMLLDTGTV